MPRWWIWTVLAVICWGLWALVSRLIGDALSPAHSQALSTLGLLPVVVALTRARSRGTARFLSSGTLFALGAGFLTCMGNTAYYAALNLGPQATTVVALGSLYPMLTVLLAVLFLKERLNSIQVTGIVLSLLAIYLFSVQREAGLLSGWILIVLVSILFWGIAGLFQKIATLHVSGEWATLWFLSAFIPVGVVIISIWPLPSGVAPRTWVWVLLLGFTFALGNYALLAAFASGGKASIIAPLAALYPIVSIPLAMLFFRERPGIREALGILVALMAVGLLSWETRPVDPPVAGADASLST